MQDLLNENTKHSDSTRLEIAVHWLYSQLSISFNRGVRICQRCLDVQPQKNSYSN